MVPRLTPFYRTNLGASYIGDSLELLASIPDGTIDLVITSPPFALLRQKTYGNVSESEYLQWLTPFCNEIKRTLKDSGSFVLDLGGAYSYGLPIRSLYNFRVLISLCDDLGFHLAEDFYWYNPAKLPSPIEWVNKRKIRAKDSVNTVWWLSKTAHPKADVKKVLVPYSSNMKKLIADPESYYRPVKRPSGHDISKTFDKDNGGGIPSNLLTIANTESNSFYSRMCKKLNIERHPARFPEDLPKFFIKMLTEPGDTVLDVFAGSNTTGVVAEGLQRKWIAFDSSIEYALGSILRFMERESVEELQKTLKALDSPSSNYFIENVSLKLKK